MATIEQKLTSKNIRVYFPEVLEAISSKKTKVERIELLRQFRDKSPENMKLITQFMECMTHPKVVFDLPEGMPPLKDNGITDYNTAILQLNKAFSKIPYFVASTQSYIKNQLKREQVFMQTLESMFKPDAELFCMIKDKKIDSKKYRGVTEQLLIDAFMPESTVVPKNV